MSALSVDLTRFTVDAGLLLASATAYWETGLRPVTAGSGVRVVAAPSPPAQIGGGT